jgi:hypothetical protein
MNKLLDGFDGIIENNDSSIQHVIGSVLFFKEDIVKQQASRVIQRIEEGASIPVRFNSTQHFYKPNDVRTTVPRLKSRKEAVQYTKEKPLYHQKTDIRICFDNDGNYIPKKDIYQYTHQRISGKKRTIINYTISHIWGNTNNPLFFSLMWNYCLVPAPYDFLTEKKDEVSMRVQNLIKAISVELYDPYMLMRGKITVDPLPDDIVAEAREFIALNKIQFVPNNF